MFLRPVGLALAAALSATVSHAAGAEPQVKVSLHPAVADIVPGSSFEVAIAFEIADGWHIYWKNPGDAGMPPRLEWKLPPDFQVGELRFPVPKRHLDPGNLITNILEGEPVLLQSLTAPRDVAPGSSVTLDADIQWLACQDKTCVPGKASVSSALGVGTAGGEPKPEVQELLQRARRALPLAPDASKYVKVSPSSTVQAVHPGQSFEILLEVAVASGNHIQSNQPPTAAFIPTHVFLERDPGLEFGKVAYPPPEEKTHPQLGKLSEYRGKVPIRVPAKVQDDATGPRVRIAGVLTAQACHDKLGTCYPPEHVAWSLELPLERSVVAEASASRVGDAFPTPAPAITETAEELEEPLADGDPLQRFLASLGLPGLLLGCFLYGLFINATPCVLPLLSVKVLGFVQQAHESRSRTALLGISFGSGVMMFFIILGFLASRGTNVLQYPAVVIALGTVVMALALSMLGVYTLQVPTTAVKLEATIRQEGLSASFGKGALAPVLGFACTGPLLAGAFGWATLQSPRIALAAFLLMGLGMAGPYMVLGAYPQWLGFLPKPGPWMVSFERIMGFLLLAMVIWLLNPLVTQIGAEGLQWTLGFLVVVALACWILGKIDFNMSAGLRWRYRGGAAVLVLVTAVVIYGGIYPLGEAVAEQQAARWAAPSDGDAASSGIAWKRWSPEAVRAAVRSGRTVLVDFTAAWCTVCKVNKKVAIDTPEVREKIEALGVEAFQGDFTSGDPAIFAELQKHGRGGVPLNLLYPAGRPEAPIVLRPNLTKTYLLEKLEEAGRSSVKGDGRPDRESISLSRNAE